MFAELEDRGYKRWEISRMDRGYIMRIIGYPRDEKGRLQDDKVSPSSPGDIKSWDEKVRDKLRNEGQDEWRIQAHIEKVRRFMSGQMEAQKQEEEQQQRSIIDTNSPLSQEITEESKSMIEMMLRQTQQTPPTTSNQ